MSLLRFALCPLTLLAAALPLRAELPSIRFDRLQPIGGAAGETIEVTVQGRDTEDVQALRFDHPGISAELVKPNQFKVAIGADVPAGTYDVRLVGRFGVSNPRILGVVRELDGATENEPNNAPETAQEIAPNLAIRGVSDGNGQDVFRLKLRKGERLTLDCRAQRLDSELDANLILQTAAGEILAANGDYFGRDPFLDVVAPADGEYLAIVHDLSYRGGYPYLLVVSTRPQIENVFPRAVQLGTQVQLTALGRNLAASGGTVSPTAVNNLPLDELKFPFTAPTDAAALARYTFFEHPTAHSVSPTAAAAFLDGFQLRVPAGASAEPALPMLLVNSAVTVEQEPNDDRAAPQSLAIPAVVGGRFDQPRDADWFELATAEAGTFFIDVYSERIAGRADPYVLVIDEQGNQVVELDDAGPRINAFDGHLRDPSGSVSLQANKKYRLLVQDRYGRGGARYQYVLEIRQPRPDFHVAAIHSENPGPSGLNLWKGGAEFLDLVVQNHDGFNGPITITAEGLPPGLHAAPTVVNNNSRGTFVLWSDASAADWTGPVQIVATADVNGQPLRREVRPYTRVWAQANVSSSRPMREFIASVGAPAPYALRIEPATLTIEAGKKAELKLIATRAWPEMKSAINVIPLAFPGNFNFGTFTIAPDQTTANLTIDIQANTRPGPYTLSVLGQAQVPYNKDPAAASKPNTLVSTPSQPVTLHVVAPAK